MTLEEFKTSVSAIAPPAGLPEPLIALWYDARGDWDKAHDIAQEMGSSDGSRIHAYLHRKEGDLGNAAYWYRRAGKTVVSRERPLEEEWEELATWFLSENR